MRMEKRKFRIGELAEHLAVERFVIRFWEKEFNLKPSRSHGGQRFYDEDDARMFAAIKELLYNRGFTIAGARKELPIIRGARVIVPVTHDIKRESKPVVTVPQKSIPPHLATLKKIKHELLELRNLLAQ
jgi:DNA-binding transcriptional MerR regulator